MSTPAEVFAFSCRLCRRQLFTSKDLLAHDTTKNARGHKKFKHQSFHADEQKEECTSMFLDPDIAKWVAKEARDAHVQRLQEAERVKDEMENEEIFGNADGAVTGPSSDRAPTAAKKEPVAEDSDEEILDDTDSDEEIITDDDDEGAGRGAEVNQEKKAAKRIAAATAAIVDPDTIYCPHCKCKIGTQCWMGSQCSCGSWVTPSFKVHLKAVDKIPVAFLERMEKLSS